MSLENVKAYYEMVTKDQNLQIKIAQVAQSNPKEVVATVIKMADEKGYSFTEAEVKIFAEDLVATMPKNGELSDSELEIVAGGKSAQVKACWGLASFVTMGLGCGVSLLAQDVGKSEWNNNLSGCTLDNA